MFGWNESSTKVQFQTETTMSNKLNALSNELYPIVYYLFTAWSIKIRHCIGKFLENKVVIGSCSACTRNQWSKTFIENNIHDVDLATKSPFLIQTLFGCYHWNPVGYLNCIIRYSCNQQHTYSNRFVTLLVSEASFRKTHKCASRINSVLPNLKQGCEQ